MHDLLAYVMHDFKLSRLLFLFCSASVVAPYIFLIHFCIVYLSSFWNAKLLKGLVFSTYFMLKIR